MTTSEQVNAVIDTARDMRQRRTRRLVNNRLELLRRLLCSCGYTNVDTAYSRQAGEVVIRQYAPVLDAARVLDIIDKPLEHWGWRVVDVWECYEAQQPYQRFVQIRAAVPACDTLS